MSWLWSFVSTYKHDLRARILFTLSLAKLDATEFETTMASSTS